MKRHTRHATFNCRACIEFYKRGRFMCRSFNQVSREGLRNEYIRVLQVIRASNKINKELER